MSLSQGTIKILGSAQNQPLERLHRLKITGTLLQEALAMLHTYGGQLFQREIVSWKIMQTYVDEQPTILPLSASSPKDWQKRGHR